MFQKRIHDQSLTVGHESLSGSELEARLQRWLSELDRVTESQPSGSYLAVMVDGSLQSHIALLAMARGNLSCVLLDPLLPASHLLSILHELGGTELFVIGRAEHPKALEEAGVAVTRLSPDGSGPFRGVSPRSNGELVVFTSGSTGRPKGVVLPWTTLEMWVEWRASVVEIVEGQDVSVGLAPLTFGSGVLTCLDLYSGTSVVTIDPAQFSPRELLKRIAGLNPTTLHLPSQLLRVLALAGDADGQTRLDSLKLLNVGGSFVEAEWVNAFSALLPETCLFNHGLSASEAARFFTFVTPLADLPVSGRVHVGTPRDDKEVRLEPFEGVADAFMVYVSGPTARGYINERDTASRWSVDDRGNRWWRSGDLVRWDSEQQGYLHVGREDDLVKVGGFLVALGDVQRALLDDVDVENAAVTSHHVAERVRLVAHLSWKSGVTASTEALRERLSQRVPPWSIPSVFLEYPSLPLTHRGKIDRDVLMGLAQDHWDALEPQLASPVLPRLGN